MITSLEKNDSQGFVFWFTGLAGAGKTTLARHFFEKLKTKYNNAVFLDGDELREIFGNDLSYSPDDRKKSAYRNAKLSAYLASQGIHVVCATISLFHEVQSWNRQHIQHYKEIFIDVPIETLQERNQKKLYSKNQNGQINHVVGLDIAPEFPKEPDMIIYNDQHSNLDEHIEKIWQDFEKSKKFDFNQKIFQQSEISETS